MEMDTGFFTSLCKMNNTTNLKSSSHIPSKPTLTAKDLHIVTVSNTSETLSCPSLESAQTGSSLPVCSSAEAKRAKIRLLNQSLARQSHTASNTNNNEPTVQSSWLDLAKKYSNFWHQNLKTQLANLQVLKTGGDIYYQTCQPQPISPTTQLNSTLTQEPNDSPNGTGLK